MEINVNQLMMELKQEDLAAEISGAINPTLDAVTLLTHITETGTKFEETKKTLEAVQLELPAGGRLGALSSKYGGLVGNSCAVNQGKFDLDCGKALMYLEDIVNLQPVLRDVQAILTGFIWLENGTKLILAKETFQKAGYHPNLRDYIERDVMGVYKIVSSKHENECEETSKLPPLDYSNPKDKETYCKAREFDFGILLIRYLPFDGIVEDSASNTLRLSYERKTQIITLDQYSEKICGLMKEVADIEITLAACELFFAKEKPIPNSNEGKALVEALKQFVTAIYELGKHTLEIYDNFKKGGKDVPYCFMEKIKAFENVSGFGLQDLNKDEPIKTGLHLRYNYKILFNALVEYRKQFIRGFGLLDY